MPKNYLDMFNDLVEEKEHQSKFSDKNDRILLIDGLNTFIRNFSVNPTTNDDGTHVGGLAGSLKSIALAIRTTTPTACVVVFDGKGGSTKRRKLFPTYKANRKVHRRLNRTDFHDGIDEGEAMKRQIVRLFEYLEALPIKTMMFDGMEADDVIGYICSNLYPESEKVVYSSDRDFIQLINDKVTIWNPIKKMTQDEKWVQHEFGMSPRNYLIYRTMDGDKSDDIDGVKGCGYKTLQKKLPLLFEDEIVNIEDVLKYSDEHKSEAKVLENISNDGKKLHRNYELMQLLDVDIPATSKSKIRNIMDSNDCGLRRGSINQMLLEDKMFGAFKNLDYWIRSSFTTLQAFLSSK